MNPANCCLSCIKLKPLLSFVLVSLFAINISGQTFYGMVQVEENLWIDATEITNNEYRQFVNYVKGHVARELLLNAGYKEFGQSISDSENPDKRRVIINLDVPINWQDPTQAQILKHLFFPQFKKFNSNDTVRHQYLNYQYTTDTDSIEKSVNVCPKRFNDRLEPTHAPTQNMLGSTYFWNPAYDDFPVVGITYEQAAAFCDWRTQLLNNYNLKIKRYSTYKKVKYKLPSEAQWNFLAGSGNLKGKYAGTLSHPENPSNKEEISHINKIGFLINSKEFQPHTNSYRKSKKEQDRLYYTVGVQQTFGFKTYHSKGKNSRIFGLAGNVAEMTHDHKILGGSWFHPIDKCVIGETIDHDPNIATNWLGFRCALTIVKSKDYNLTQ